MKNIAIYGCGGLGIETLQLIKEINKQEEQWNFVGFLDDLESNHGKRIYGYKVLGGQEYLEEHKDLHVVIAIANPHVRKNIAVCIQDLCKLPTLIHPSIDICEGTVIGRGSIIFKNSTISVYVTIGEFVIINPMCGIGHGSIICSFATLMWNVIIAGDCLIMSGVTLGSSSTVIQGLVCEPYSYIGAGATVIKTVKAKNVVVGTPAKFLRYNV